MLGYFHDLNRANAAARKVQAAGFRRVQVDQITPYPGEGIERRMNPTTGRMSGLADLVLDSDLAPGADSGVLLATNTAASGLSADKERVRGHNVLVTVVVENDDEAARAAALLEKLGGMA